MRVFVVGASGAIGRRLVPQLLERGHEVIGSARSPEKAERLRRLGAESVVLDALDARAVREAVAAARPDAIVYQATALTGISGSDLKHFDRTFAQTNRLRSEGTDNLLAAAREAGVGRFVAQSNVTNRYAREGGPVKSEDDPLDPNPLASARESVAALDHLDSAVTDAGGIALRYGIFYGDPEDGMVEAVRGRKFPVVGDGAGVWSFIHLDDAAAATVLALEHDGPAVYNVVDDEPSPIAEWLPELARIVGAKPPRRFPVWLARLFAGEAPVVMATESRGASNAKAKRELGWTLRYPSWRQGFADYAKPTAAPSGLDRFQSMPSASGRVRDDPQRHPTHTSTTRTTRPTAPSRADKGGEPMSDLQAIADRVEIEALRAEYTDAGMMRDYDRFASLFTEDAALRWPHIDKEFVGREEIRAAVERLQDLWDYFVQTVHPGTTQVEGDTATGRAFVAEFGRFREGSSHLNYAVYHDRYRRTPDGWKFAERVYEVRYLDTTPLAGSAPHAAESAR